MCFLQEYLKVHKKLQRLTGRKPRRTRDMAASTSSSNGSESAVLASDSSDPDDDMPYQSLDQEVDLLDGSAVLAADPTNQKIESSESTSAKPLRDDASSAQLRTPNQSPSNGLASPTDADDSPEPAESSDLDHDSAGSSGADTVSEDESEHMASEDPSVGQMLRQASRLRSQMG